MGKASGEDESSPELDLYTQVKKPREFLLFFSIITRGKAFITLSLISCISFHRAFMYFFIFNCSSGTDNVRKRPLIVFDGSSTKTGSIKLKRADDLPVTDHLKSPPSNINLCNPIRKLSGSSTNSSSSQTSAGSARSPTGNGSAPSLVQSNCMSMKLKRGASSSGAPESPVSTVSYSTHITITGIFIINNFY